jgi:hypothetical protein
VTWKKEGIRDQLVNWPLSAISHSFIELLSSYLKPGSIFSKITRQFQSHAVQESCGRLQRGPQSVYAPLQIHSTTHMQLDTPTQVQIGKQERKKRERRW